MVLKNIPDVEAIVDELLKADLPAESAIQTKTWQGPVRSQDDVGQLAVFIQASGGFDESNNDTNTPRVGVSVVVRFTSGSYTAARTLAWLIHRTLHLAGKRTVATGSVVDVKAVGAAPDYIGPGDDDAEYFVESFEVWMEAAS